MFSLVQAIVLVPAKAEKVALDVYVDICRNVTRLAPAGDDPPSCVLAPAHRQAVEHRRSRRATAARGGAVHPRPAPVCAPSGLNVLDRVSRELLLLAYYGGYTCDQAATLLGLSAAAAQLQLRTALRTLAEDN